jgi:hypothetical protein
MDDRAIRHNHRIPFSMSFGLIFLLLVTSVLLPQGAEAQSASEVSAVVLSEALNVRSGPGVTYTAVSYLTQDDEVPVIGRHATSGWWQIRLPDGASGWISGGDTYVQVYGDVDAVPDVALEDAPSSAAGAAEGVIIVQPVTGGDIYTVSPDGGDLRYLASGIDPALSPDGSKIAFTRWENDQHGANGSVWTVNLDGTGERAVLGEIPQPKSPAWSPSGDRLVIGLVAGGRLGYKDTCSSQYPTEPIVTKESPGEDKSVRLVVEIDPDGELDYKFCYTLLPHPYWGLGVVDVSTAGYEGVPSDLFSYAPTWDPLNDWHVVYEGELGLVSLDVNRGVTWPLTDDPSDRAPVFSPDGQKIAVTYWQNDHYEIHVLNADGTGRVRLTQTPLSALAEQRLAGISPRSYNNAAPAWSPDGSQIAFVSDRGGQWQFWVMNADGSNQRLLFPDGPAAELAVQYNGVGERLLSWR